MCKDVDMFKSHPAIGLFRKGNEGEDMRIPIEVAPCACGKMSYAKVKGNTVWVECQRVVSEREIDKAIEADAFPDK